MSEPHEETGLTPERVERLMRTARVARSHTIRAALSGVFRRLRGALVAKPGRRREAHPAAC
jgi:hypothetical protein